VLAAASSLAAQPAEPIDPAAAEVAIPAARRVRVDADGLGPIEGAFLGSDGKSLLLGPEDRERSVPLGSIRALWVRGRRTVQAAGIGGAAGGVLGLAYGLLICSLVEEDGGGCGDLGPVALLTLAGSGAGAGVGALVGSALPRWTLRWQRPADAAEARPLRLRVVGGASTAAVGSLALTAGYSALADPDQAGGSVGGSIRLMASVLPFVAVGPEAGLHRFGRRRFSFADVAYSVDQRVWHLGGVVRLGPAGGRLRPYALGGLGVYGYNLDSLSTEEYFGGSLGAGVEADMPGRRIAGVLEGRWHAPLEDKYPGPEPDGRFFTLAGGVSLRW
jgi:hypothetical protein